MPRCQRVVGGFLMSEEVILEGINKLAERLALPENQSSFKNWSKTILFQFTDLNQTYLLPIENGIAKEIQKVGNETNADIKIVTDTDTFIKIRKKELSGMKAFQSGKLKVNGSFSDLMKLRKIL